MKHWLVITLVCSALALLAPPVAFGYPIWDDGWYPTPCSACAGSQPPDCAIGAAGVCPHQCGGASTACCGQGSTWTKYTTSCRVVNSDNGLCDWVWVKGPRICSTGDKCVAGETGLRPGMCNCSFGASIYKTCCNGPNPVACGQYFEQDGIDPPEGTCATNGGVAVPCGGANQPACGAAACSGPTPTAGKRTDR